MEIQYRRSFPRIRKPMAIVLATFLWPCVIHSQDLAPSMRDSVRTFIFDQFAEVHFETSLHPDSVLWGGATVHAPPASVWIMGDYGAIKGRSYLEAGLSTDFLLRKNSLYPLAVTIPVSTTLGDEEYFLGPQFAYISSGVNVRIPLSFIPNRYGKWSAGSNADFCYYGKSATESIRSFGLQLPKITAVFSIEL